MWFNILFEGAMQELRDLFPNASDNELATALTSACGNVNRAAEHMLGAGTDHKLTLVSLW